MALLLRISCYDISMSFFPLHRYLHSIRTNTSIASAHSSLLTSLFQLLLFVSRCISNAPSTEPALLFYLFVYKTPDAFSTSFLIDDSLGIMLRLDSLVTKRRICLLCGLVYCACCVHTNVSIKIINKNHHSHNSEMR